MSFTSYQSTGAVLKQFQIVYNESNYIVEAEMPVNDYFRVELQMTIGEGVVDNFRCGNLRKFNLSSF